MGKNRMKDRHDKLAYKMKYGEHGGLIKNTLNITQGALNAAAVAAASYGGIQIYEAAAQNPEMLGRYVAAGIAATVAAGCLYGLGKLSIATAFKKIPSFIREGASRVGRIVGGVVLPIGLSACLIFGGGGEEPKDIPVDTTQPVGICQQCGQRFEDLEEALKELGEKVDSFKGCTCQQNQQKDPPKDQTEDPTTTTDPSVDITEPSTPVTDPTTSTEPSQTEPPETTGPSQTEPPESTEPPETTGPPKEVDQHEHVVDTNGNSTTQTGTVKTNTTTHEMSN